MTNDHTEKKITKHIFSFDFGMTGFKEVTRRDIRSFLLPGSIHWPSCSPLRLRAPTGRCSRGCTGWRRASSGWSGSPWAPGPAGRRGGCSVRRRPVGGRNEEPVHALKGTLHSSALSFVIARNRVVLLNGRASFPHFPTEMGDICIHL